MKTKDLPLGIRLNNPGNLRAIKSKPVNWLNQIGAEKGFCKFSSMHYGIRALCKLIMTYNKRGWCDNSLAFATHYAPVSDGNDTLIYSDYISSAWSGSKFYPIQLAILVMQIEVGINHVTKYMINSAIYWSCKLRVNGKETANISYDSTFAHVS